MNLKFRILTCICFTLTIQAIGQDRAYVNKIVKDLASSQMDGRGYIDNGCNKAAVYLANEMKIIGLQSFDNNYLQPYRFDVNTFPGKIALKIDQKKLEPGTDFVVHARSQSIKKSFELLFLPDTVTCLESVYQLADTNKLEGKMVVVPESLKNAYRTGIPGIKYLAQTVSGALWWHVSRTQNIDDQTILKIKKEALPTEAKQIHLHIESQMIFDFEANNVVGFVPGSVEPDSFFVFVAHYDHLGRMGKKTLFPGASDNASGTAAVLDLARFYVSNPEKAYYSMVFILVSGEEAGLRGSTYNAENPQFSLDKTRMLINFDMVGTGSDGITVVQGEIFPEFSDVLIRINEQQNLLPRIALRGESCNSDHCPYYQKGVPAFFIHTNGDENREYHTITDVYQKLPFTAYENFFRLITAFVDQVRLPIFNRSIENN